MGKQISFNEINVLGYLFFYSLNFFPSYCTIMPCFHDVISISDVPMSFINYKKFRHKRDTYSFEPLKIYVHYENLNSSLDSQTIEKIEAIMNKAIKTISTILHVRPIKNPFLLERKCDHKWIYGKNAGKCSSYNEKGEHEYCKNYIDKYQIPNEFLQELHVFKSSNGKQINYTLSAGKGLNNTNFLLFVLSKMSSWCKHQHVLAYGSYCRLDQFNRPIAGLLNFCPDFLSRNLFEVKYYFNLIMHELFHILGFSKELFSKYNFCLSVEQTHFYNYPKKIVQEDKHGIYRLLLPSVIESIKQHTNCSQEVFGAPLAKKNGSFDSHWHQLLMYSSIMTPAIIDHDYAVIDNITLSLFASTGWYKVDFSKAENFIWGKKGGCAFGFNNCEENLYLCNPNNTLKKGCDILHNTIGTCYQLTDHPCGIFKYNETENCKKNLQTSSNDVNRYIENFDDYKCVLEKDGKDSHKPICLAAKCDKSKNIQIFFNSWTKCEVIQENMNSNNNASFFCPKENFCSSNTLKYLTSAASTNKHMKLSLLHFLYVGEIIFIFNKKFNILVNIYKWQQENYVNFLKYLFPTTVNNFFYIYNFNLKLHYNK